MIYVVNAFLIKVQEEGKGSHVKEEGRIGESGRDGRGEDEMLTLSSSRR